MMRGISKRTCSQCGAAFNFYHENSSICLIGTVVCSSPCEKDLRADGRRFDIEGRRVVGHSPAEDCEPLSYEEKERIIERERRLSRSER